MGFWLSYLRAWSEFWFRPAYKNNVVYLEDFREKKFANRK